MSQSPNHFVSPEIGLMATSRLILEDRVYISYGLKLLAPRDAIDQGYLGSEALSPRVIVPANSPRPATAAETLGILAGPGTERVMRLHRLPLHIGHTLLEQCRKTDSHNFDETAPMVELVPGIVGNCVDSRTDDPGQLTVTADPGQINPLTGRPAKVGMHIDGWRNDRLSYLVGNAGPGERWHCLVPSFSRQNIGGVGARLRERYIAAHPSPDTIATYWIKLEAPTQEGMEVLTNSPVASMLHDGSTWSATEPSTAFFCAIDRLDPEQYESII